MGLVLDDRLRERLRQVRAAQLRDLRYWQAAEDLLVDDEVVCARCGLGNASFVGLDGRVLFWNFGDGHPPEELTDPASVACVVGWLAEAGVPELLDALPPMPPGGRPCRSCRGRRWARRAAGAGPGSLRRVCGRCYGQGWTPA